MLARTHPSLIEFLHPFDHAIASLALGLRTVVLDELAPCHEYIFRMRNKVVLLYGPTENVIKDNVCIINVFPKHVTLMFQRGSDLKDPTGALKGTGKRMRHLRLKRLSELDRPELRALLRRARKLAGPNAWPRGSPGDIVTRVKTSPARRGSDAV